MFSVPPEDFPPPVPPEEELLDELPHAASAHAPTIIESVATYRLNWRKSTFSLLIEPPLPL
jgi:hypothetical protein